MNTLRSLLLLLASALSLAAAAPQAAGPLHISADGRSFQQADGSPFFWLGDTTWLITQKLNREEVKTYFANRQAKGFNVVQLCVVQFLTDKCFNGNTALVDGDITKLNVTPGADPADPAQYDYWDHVDYVVDTAAAHGIHVAIAPVWSHMVKRTPLTAAQVGPYIEQVARRYQDRPNVLWLNGGSGRGRENAEVWQVIGETLKRLAPAQLVSYHPFGRTVTTEWFKGSAWLDFHMFTSGHRRYDQDIDGRKYGEDNWRYVLEARAADPRRPVLDAEPAYENTPQGLHQATEPYWTADDSRRYAYWSVFAGAAGHTFGENSVRQVYIPAEAKPASGAKGFIMDRLETDGARQMIHLKNLMLSRPFFGRDNDQSLVAGDEGEKYDRVLVTRGPSHVFAYTYTGRDFTLQLGSLAGGPLQASWFNPRTGETSAAGTVPAAGAHTFNPPGEPAPGRDWVLVLDVPTDTSAWAQVPAILARIVAPVFPARTFAITDHGAVPGGSVKCTEAIARAIQACHEAGGGRVVVPAGRFLTGPIHLRSNVELHVSAGAELVFSDDPADYLPAVLSRVGGIDLYNYSALIYARDCENIAITGPGRLNGNARAWWPWAPRQTKRFFEMGAEGVPVEQRVFATPEAAIRPSFVHLVNCRNILLQDFTIGSGPNWTIHPVYCENTTIRGVHVVTDGPNNDGIDPDSCRDMLIEDCTFDTGDDCVVLKSGYNQDGWRVARPTENIIMRRCFSQRGHGGLVIGSEMSGDVRNVFMEDCEFEGTDRAIRLKSRADRGGVVEHVYARNLKVRNMQREAIILHMDYGSDRQPLLKTAPPVFRHMRFENITGQGAPIAILIQGMEASPIQDIQFARINLVATKGVVASHARGITFEDVFVQPAKGPVYDLTDASDIVVRDSRAPVGTEVFLKAAGDCGGIQLEGCDLTQARQPFVTGPGVVPNGVVIR